MYKKYFCITQHTLNTANCEQSGVKQTQTLCSTSAVHKYFISFDTTGFWLVEVQHHSFFTSALNAGKWSPRYGRFTSVK